MNQTAAEVLSVLHVEDSPADARLVAELLGRSDGLTRFDLAQAGSVEEAVRALTGRTYDAVVLDLNLPDSTGLESLERVRSECAEAAVVVLTSDLGDSAGLVRRLVEAADDYLLKDDLGRGRSLANTVLWAVERRRRDRLASVQGVIERLALGVLVLDEEGKIVFANQAAAGLFARGRDELVGSPFGYPVQDAAQEVQLRVGGAGRFAYAELRTLPTTWEGAPATLATLQDITHRKWIAESLRSLVEGTTATGTGFFEALATSLVEVLHVQAAAVLRADAGERRLLARARRGLTGRTALEAGGAEALDDPNALVVPITGDDGRVLGELSISDPRGVTDPALVLQPLRLLALRCAAELERLDAEELLRESREQLFQSQKMEALGTLASGVAHDFNNLLTVILGHSEMLQWDLVPGSPGWTSVRQIELAGRRSAELVKQLLGFGRKQTQRLEALDLNAEVREAEGMLARLIGEQIRIETRLASTLPPVRADRGQLGQIVLNLAVNARDAIGAHGTITLETASVVVERPTPEGLTPGHYLRLSVRDDGAGMRPEVLERIFEPFFTTKEPGRGTGLGLSTIYGIVRQTGGAVKAESRPGAGTTIHVFFPAAAGASDDAPGARRRPSLGSRPRGTILLLEDEGQLGDLLARVLEAAGHTVLRAATGREGLEVAAAHAGAIDALVADVVTPELSGPELAERLTAERPELRTLFITGYPRDSLRRIPTGPDAPRVLRKPFAPEALLQAVDGLLATGGRGEPPPRAPSGQARPGT